MIVRLVGDAAYIYSLLLFVYAMLSWFPGGYQSAFGRFLTRICEPYLSLFDRWNLHIGPIDFTIMAAVIILNLATQGLGVLVNMLANMIY